MRLAANLTWLFTDVPMLDRFALAAEAGFTGVEMLSPYDHDIAALRDMANVAGLEVVLINAPPPNYTGGAQGWAAVPGLEARCASDLTRAARAAKVLGAGMVHVMSGDANGPKAEATMIANLRAGADAHPDLTLMIEPICPAALPDYFLNDYDLAMRILRAVDRPNVALQFDTYHASQITGDLTAAWHTFGASARHIQIGSGADRSEPYDMASFLDLVDQAGYRGWISAEYRPKAQTADGLDWMTKDA